MENAIEHQRLQQLQRELAAVKNAGFDEDDRGEVAQVVRALGDILEGTLDALVRMTRLPRP